jgi:hypothetical protein
MDMQLPLMRLLVDFHCNKYGQHDCFAMPNNIAERIPVAFWVKMMERYAFKRNEEVEGETREQGFYHLHSEKEDEEACEVCARLREGSEMGYESEDDSEMSYGSEGETDSDDDPPYGP